MFRIRSVRLVPLLVALITALTVWGPPPAAVAADGDVLVTGKVSGTPLGEVYFGSISFIVNNNNVRTVQLTSDGRYNITLPIGTYEVQASGNPYPSGSGRFGDFSITRPAVSVAGPMTLDLTLPLEPITIELSDGTPTPVTARASVQCNATIDGTAYHLNSTVSGTGTVAQWGLPKDVAGPGYDCNVLAQQGTAPASDTVPISVTTTGENVFPVVVPRTVRISGRITASGLIPNESWAYDDEGRESGYMDNPTWNTSEYDTQAYSYDFLPGIHNLALNFHEYDSGPEVNRQEHRWVLGVDATESRTLDFDFPTRPIDLHFVDREGGPLAVDYSYSCLRNVDYMLRSGGTDGPRDRQAFDSVHSHGYTDSGTVTVRIPPVSDNGHAWSCQLSASTGADWMRASGPLPAGDELTMVVPAGATFEGTADEPADTDGVSNLVEAQAPNGGDGNGDGTPDSEQANVTSLPAKDAAPGEDAAYVTVAGPPGSTLSEVSTIDPETLGSDPPDGVVLPAGLVSFKLNVASGATETVKIFGGSVAGVNGYAKYDPVTETWSILPAGLVQVHEEDGEVNDHVDVTLTDGGAGDADGAENGVIDDPGGIAKLPVASDTTPPVVTGSPTTGPNSAGWYSNAVKIAWTAVDPGSGVAVQPGDTTVTEQGANVTAQSPEVCDMAATPNCARGQVSGLRIDRSAPAVTVKGVTDGATYTLGSAPTPGCHAYDGLSGLKSACKGARTGGNAKGVGLFTYAASAIDRAGNARVVKATYRVVYRFDGFLAPLNNPPSAVSVFKAGSTAPVGITVKRANGTVVTPVLKPVWVTPLRGARTSAAVNEAVSSAKGSTGTTFTWKNNRWQYDWSTKGVTAGYLYRIGVRLDDGTTHYLNVGLR